jgi:hypothetical protein
METYKPSYEELETYYNTHFSLNCFNTTLENRLGLIALICFLTNQARKKSPDVTCWKVIMKVLEKEKLTENQIKYLRGLAIMCTDIMQSCTEFPDFGLKSSKEMIQHIKSVFGTWRPF